MNTLIQSIASEFRRYKALAEGALAQVPDESLTIRSHDHGNSLAIICWHVSGNLQSRFTDFLTSDGEKPWRDREEEFALRTVPRADLLAKWNTGWNVLFDALAPLTDEELTSTITIRQQPMAVHEALHRSLAHASYHVGQIVYLAHALSGPAWHYLTIPPGGSNAYNAAPLMEKPLAHAEKLASANK